METETNGFSVEVTDTTVKFFTVEQGVVERDNFDDENTPEADKTEVGIWYDIFPDGYEKRPEVTLPEFNVFERDGQCHVRVVAIGPNYFSLPKEIRSKFKHAVWAPHIGYLNDKEMIFNRYVPGGVAEQCIVKYAPTDKHVFEIVEIEDRVGELETASMSIYQMNPWTLELMAKNMRPIHEVVPEFLGCIQKTKGFSIESQTIGVCIAHKEENWSYKPQTGANPNGTEKYCSYLWSHVFGLIRWPIKPDQEKPKDVSEEPVGSKKYTEPTDKKDVPSEDRVERLGKWYSFKLNDGGKKDKKQGFERDHVKPLYQRAVATMVVPVDAQKPFKVITRPQRNPGLPDRQALQIKVSFPFKPHEMVDPTFGVTQFMTRIRDDAHFFDSDLGRVEIYPSQAIQILEEIYNHQDELQELNPVEYEKSKNEVIIIIAWVVVVGRFLENFQKHYPSKGLFKVKKVEKIHYLQGGRTIFENADN